MQRLLCPDVNNNAQFGNEIGISGDYIISGSRNNSKYGSQSGTAYIFKRTGETWNLEQELIDPSAGPGRNFSSCDINGNIAIVGADTPSEILVYERSGTTWALQTTLSEPTMGFFGLFVSYDGTHLIIGDENEYFITIYSRSGSTWSRDQELHGNSAQFGKKSAVNGNTIIVGDMNDNSSTGSVYVYSKIESTWTEQQKLVPSDGNNSDEFGSHVGISGNNIVVGAHHKQNGGGGYIFTKIDNTWTETNILTLSAATDNTSAGAGVAIYNGTVVLGGHGSWSENEHGVFIYTGTPIITINKTLPSSSLSAYNKFSSYVPFIVRILKKKKNGTITSASPQYNDIITLFSHLKHSQ